MGIFSDIRTRLFFVGLFLAFIIFGAPSYAALLEKDKTSHPQYAPGEILVKFAEGVNPQAILQEVKLNTSSLKRIHSIKHIAAKFRKDFKLDKDSDGWYWFRGKSYYAIGDISDEEFFRQAYQKMSPEEKSIYRAYKVKLAEKMSVKEAISILEKHPGVIYAEPNYTATTHAFPETLPNDTFVNPSGDGVTWAQGTWGQAYEDSWGLKKIGVNESWVSCQGEGIVVAVVDSGVDYNHEDIFDNIWVNPTIVTDTNGDLVIDIHDLDLDQNRRISQSERDQYGSDKDVFGWDFATFGGGIPDNDPADNRGHGTHVAGTIAALGNNGKGIIGVAPRAKIMPVKGMGPEGYGYIADLAQCITYAAEHGAHIINNSWGAYWHSRTLEDEVVYAASLGCVLVASAGNDALDRISYLPIVPACYEQVITVGAMSPYADPMSYAYFSNYGYKIDVFAPGYDIVSLRAEGTTYGTPVDDNYIRLQGTSMASPHVSGLIALILEKDIALPTESIRQLLRITAHQWKPGVVFHEHSAHGYIKTQDALTYDTANLIELVKIIDPYDYELVGASSSKLSVPISIEVSGGGYELYVGDGEYPSEWTLLTSGTGTASGTVHTLDVTDYESGFYALKLVSVANSEFEDRHAFIVSNDTKVGWDISDIGFEGTCVKVADLNNDGADETIYATPDDLYVLDASGAILPGWPKGLLKMEVDSNNIIVADLDNNGSKEIVIGHFSFKPDDPENHWIHLYIYGYNGSLTHYRVHFPINIAPDLDALTGKGQYLACDDIDNDGMKDLVFALFYWPDISNGANTPYKIAAINNAGEMLDGWPQELVFPGLNGGVGSLDGGEFVTLIGIADIDKDDGGAKEVVFFNGQGRLRVFEHTGALKSEWSKWLLESAHEKESVSPGLFIADIDGNREYEIVATVNRRIIGDDLPGNLSIHAWDKNSQDLSGFPIEVGENRNNAILNNLALVNLDTTDDELEILTSLVQKRQVGTNNFFDIQFYAYQHTGAPLSGFPTEGIVGADYNFVVADINNDGEQEILLASHAAIISRRHYDCTDHHLVAFDSGGNLISSFDPFYFDVPHCNNFYGIMAVSDPDQNGQLNLILAGDKGYNLPVSSRLFNFELDQYTDFDESVEYKVPLCNTLNTRRVFALMLGDVDMSGRVTMTDAIQAAEYSLELRELTDEQISAANVDGVQNGRNGVSMTDAIMIAEYSIGLRNSWP
jgi:subtilisin family serine protease